MEAKTSAWLLLVLSVAALLASNAAPLPQLPELAGDEVLTRLNKDLDNLLETGETAARVFSVTPEQDAKAKAKQQERKDKIKNDPYKQRGTYNKDMKKNEKAQRWANRNTQKVKGVVKKYDPLNDFKSAKDQKKRALKIAKDIFNIIHKPVAKKAEKAAEKRAISSITKKGKKDANFLHRIIVKSKKRDRRENKHQRKDNERMAKEKRKPKKAIKNRILSGMAKEDKKLEKDPKIVPDSIREKVERDGLPLRKKLTQNGGSSHRSLDDN